MVETVMFRKINTAELSCDLGIILFSAVLPRIYDSLIDVRLFSVPFTPLFLLFAVYFLPILLGDIWNNSLTPQDRILRRSLVATLVCNLLFVFGNIMYYTLHREIVPETQGMVIGVMAMVLLLMGPIAGFMFTSKRSAPDKLSAQVTISIVTCGLLFLFFLLMCGGEWFENVWGLFQFFIIIGFIIGDAVLIMLAFGALYAAAGALSRRGLLEPLKRAFAFSIPFWAAFLLTVFNLHATRLIFGSIGTGTAGGKLLVTAAFVFSGVIPLRVILALKPPYSSFNIFLGALSVGLLLLTVFR